MKDELISFETAKLAKEKGFNEPCRYFCNNEVYNESFRKDATFTNTDLASDYLKDLYNNSITQPTQSLLQKWLRETFKLHIKIDLDEEYFKPIIIDFNHGNKAIVLPVRCNTYEIALEYGEQKALKQIKS